MTLETLQSIDSQDMYAAIKSFPEQWREGRERALQADLHGLGVESCGRVLVTGMGGSAIGGDLLRTLVASSAEMPVLVSRAYTVPAWVDEDTLVIVSSYSGNTEESLSALEDALARKASVACITTGGEVLRRAQSMGLPYILLPSGLQPRAALGYSLTALLTIAQRIGISKYDNAAWQETQEILSSLSESLGNPASSDNAAFSLAEKLQGLMPFVYSDGSLEAVNLRWRSQIQENSKVLACGNVFPELNHNEITGWEQPSLMHKHIGIVVLRDQGEHSRVKRRIEVTRSLLDDRAACWHEVWSQGQSLLARMMSLVYFGDWVSLYLATLQGIDPSPIHLITRLKNTMNGEDSE